MELVNSVSLFVSVPAMLASLVLFAVAVIGAAVTSRVFSPPEGFDDRLP